MSNKENRVGDSPPAIQEVCISCSNLVTGDKSSAYDEAYNRSCSKCRGSYVTFNPEEYVTKPDMVNSPSHYCQGSIESIDSIEAALSEEQFIGYLQGSALKYLLRGGKKNDDILLDIRKSKWFLKKLLEELSEEE